MMRPCPYPVETLLPHAPPMVLLDAVEGWDDRSLVACLTIRPETPFCEAGLGVPAHIGIEWMAQACGAFAGLGALTAARPVRLGFLLGTRRFQAARPWFAIGQRLRIAVSVVLREDGMGVFDCRIEQDGVQLASAQLSLFQPEDADAVLAQ